MTVCCGSTEAMLATLLAVLDPGDEIIIFEPFYENYGRARSSPAPSRCSCRSSLRLLVRPGAARARLHPRTRAIIFNTPNNPTSKVFTRRELEIIAELCQRHDVLAITDEIYEHMVYDGLGTSPSPRSPGCGTAP